MQLSERVQQIKPSATLAVTARAKAMRAEGVDVVSFGAGEPDFDTPAHIKAAAIRALEEGVTKYQPTAGTPEAREAVADYMNDRFGYAFQPDQVLISSGGKHALYLAFQAVLNPGDEVLLPAPYWVSYPEQARLAGGVVRAVPGGVDREFKITPDQLRDAITDRTRVLVINSPSNPTGMTYTPAELRDLAAVAAEHPRLVVFSDEIYERLIYDETEPVSFGRLREDLADRVVTFNCLSKTYAMTGWRIGFTLGPADLIRAMAAMQGQMTSNITSFNYAAIPQALQGPRDEAERMRRAFEQRGEHLHRRLSAMDGIQCPRPRGAFYVFPDVSRAVFGRSDPAGAKMKSAADFAASLLEHARVAVVPGEDFGGPDHVRLSFATSMAQIDEGLDRMQEYLNHLK